MAFSQFYHSYMEITAETITTYCSEVTFVDDEQHLKNFTCIICRSIPKEPIYQVSCCGKHICKTCFDKSVKCTSQACPHCRTPSVKQNCFKDTNMCQRIKSLRVYCKNKQFGCEWQSELCTLEQHVANCKYKLKPCPNCEKPVPIDYYKHHILHECPARAYNCQYCGKPGTYASINNDHLPICPEYPVTCPNKCSAHLKRCNVAEHRQKHCTREIVHCKYHVNGCEVSKMRMDISKHEQNCPKVVRGVGSSSLSYVLPINFRIKEYSTLKAKNHVWSHDFWTSNRGYHMSFEIYTNGCKGDGTISCYIRLQCGEYDNHLSWPFRGIFQITLRSQVGVNHHTKEIHFLTSCPDKRNSKVCEGKAMCGIGEPNYISPRELDQYLYDDTLLFSINLKGNV